MSQTRNDDYIGKPPDERKPPNEYPHTADGCIAWCADYLGVELTAPQREIVRCVFDNQRTIIVGANGFGKTYTIACMTLAWLYTTYPATVLATSGTYPKLKRTYCRPIENLHASALGLPGRYLNRPPRIEIDGEPEHFWEATSPADPGELEGAHNKYTLGIVEEADKKDVDADLIDSMTSLITSDNDRVVVVANPPADETNVVYDLQQDDTWASRRFSSFDSHNVQVELGNTQGDKIEKLVTLDQIEQDWRSYNGLDWPGVDDAVASDARDDLDVRWYRRRLGMIPPQAADAPRPFTVADVRSAFGRKPEHTTATPGGLSWDVARGSASGDWNAVGAWFGRELRILDWWRHTGDTPHLQNEETVRGLIAPGWHAPFAVDYVGVGSESYDRVSEFYPNAVKYNAGAEAESPMSYANRWTESLCLLGDMLRDGAGFTNQRLREELLAAARTVELEETYVNKHDTTRYSATPKDNVKDRLGRSPDLLDAAAMATVMASYGDDVGRDTVPSTW